METVRSPTGAVRLRTICYLGRLDNRRPPDGLRLAERLPDPAWLPRLQAAVGQVPPPAGGPVATGEVIPESISWTRPRRFGEVYSALRAWQSLGLDRRLQRLVGGVGSRVPMAVIAALIAVNRLVDPRSERGIYHWLPGTALPELLDDHPARLTLDHLYRCLSLVEPHKTALEKHRAEQGRDLCHCTNDLLLYDLTSTYFEGRLEHNAKAQRGYARDHRPDCKQLCIGLVVNRDGFPLGWETLPGNRRDAPTLWPMITALERRCGRNRRLLGFDRGMATEANLRDLRRSNRPYVCAPRRAVVREHWPVIRRGPWTVVQATHRPEAAIAVQELPTQCHDDVSDCHTGVSESPNRVRERWLLCRSAGCRLKEQPICDARSLKARTRLAKWQQPVAAGTCVTPAVILAKAKKAVGRTHDRRGVFTFALENTPTGQRLQVQENATALQDEHDLQGVYLPRSTDRELSAEDRWRTYLLLTRVAAAFRHLKTDLNIRPIYHRQEHRGDAHVVFSVLAYAMSVAIQRRHRRPGGPLTTAALLEALQPLGLAELSYRTSDGNRLAFERAAAPSAEQQAILESLNWPLPEKYLPPNLEAEPRRVV